MHYLIALFLCFSSLSFAEESLRVMTFNVRYDSSSDKGERDWSKRVKRIVKMIQEVDPDIIGFQEVLPQQLWDLYWKLGEYKHFGDPREGWSLYYIPRGEYAPIFYKKKRLELLDSGTFWLNETKTPVQNGWDADSYRIATWGEFFDRKNQSHFFFFNTHLDHIGPVARKEGMALISSEVEEKREREVPAIVVGDLNGSYRTLAVPGLVGGRESAARVEGPKGTFNGWRGSAFATLDYILTILAFPWITMKLSPQRITRKSPLAIIFQFLRRFKCGSSS